MTNLRLIQASVVNSNTITATFTENLSRNIGPENVLITSNLNGIADSQALIVQVTGNTLTITVLPLIPMVSYFVIFQSTSISPFISLNGDATLSQDGITNRALILGPVGSDNVVQDFMTNFLKDNIYDKIYDTSSIIYSIVQAYSTVMSQALHDIHQVKNENYLSFTVNDEQHIRGQGPFDRLLQESAYEILRVGRTPLGFSATLNVLIPDFGVSPVSLLATSASDTLTAGSTDTIGKFNIDDLVLTVSNQDVSILTSVVFNYNGGGNPYTYPISIFGYQILDSKYDQEFASSYALLNNNQFKLSASVLDDPNFSLHNINNIQVSYQYRDLGRIVDATTVRVTTVLQSVRETLPPIINVFNLQHAPVTDSSGNPATVGGVTFIDPNGLTPTSLHPAFITEIPFRLSALPSSPGEFSIDYPTGTVYVYGSDTTNSGTGPLPPLATYFYLHTYVSEIDYVYDSTTNDLVALPFGSLLDNSGTISFKYEQVLVPGIDYQSNVHIESLSERIGNRLLALNVLQTQNSPITDVFKVFNETSGEIYNVVRWFQNKIYFTFNTPPRVLSLTGERASFQDIHNELLIINNSTVNIGGVIVDTCFLSNNNLIDSSEDGIGSFVNSSVSFSNPIIFVQERWFDAEESVTNNINRLSVGQYQIDYANGIVYIAVSNTQGNDLGTISYKNGFVIPQNPHLISVDDIYYQISFALPKDKEFSYTKFSDGYLIPSSFDPSDEAFLNGFVGAPYQLFNNQIGAFSDVSPFNFIPTVTNNIKFIRGIFEFNDLKNSTNPINFAPAAIFSGRTITLGDLSNQQYATVQFNGSQYFVDLNANIPYLSPNLTFTISIVRNSDSAQLWNGSGVIVPGNPVQLILPGINSPHTNDAVTVTYSISINNLSRVIVDYNKGDYFIDYSYLADEIIVSYEHGDNVIDFSQSLTVSSGDQYFVSYRAGALRDALIKNFGSLINIPELSTFDVDLARERYRDALTAALTSFLQGPTIASIKNICNSISHIEPEITESAFTNWSLGSSLLTPRAIETNGTFSLMPAKFGNGLLIDQPGQTVTVPIVSNLRLEQGSFETWIIPEWNGLDNDATITLSVMKDGYVLPSDQIFVGASEYHPKYNSKNLFSLTKNSEVIGFPNTNKDGVFIYYAADASGAFDRWYCEVVDGYSDGYGDGYSTNYTIKITTDGLFYDAKSLEAPQPANLRMTTGTQTLTFSILSGPAPLDEGVTFLADREHYLLDFGEEEDKNRFSIFKDPSGYFNFRVFDKNRRPTIISADVSGWRAGDKHQIAASWKLNNKNFRDEMHLFIDGFEVPNIIRYGTKLAPYLHERYRTVNPEEIAGIITANIVGSTDLHTTAGLNTVTSSINFSANGIQIGNTIFINEPGFSTSGYAITFVNGQTLTLASPMPLTLTNASFSVNQVTLPVVTEIDIYPNIAVFTISSILNGSDLSTFSGSPVFTSTGTNFGVAGVKPGYLVRVDNPSFVSHYTILSVSGNSLTVNGNAPANLTNATFHIYRNNPVELPGVRALHPDYSISDNASFQPTLTITNGAHANDLVLIETLGINHRRTRQKFYQWGYISNIIATYLPPPISLNQVEIFHILLDKTIINSSNSTVVLNTFTSSNLTTDQPSLSTNGRTLEVAIYTNNNIDFSTPVTVNINGNTNSGTITETLTFNQVGTQNTVHRFEEINYVSASGKFINQNKTFLVLSVQEAFPITTPENSSIFPVIRYSYQITAGTALSGTGGSVVTDPATHFSRSFVGDYLVISSPASVAGTYQILAVSNDFTSATLNANLAAFSGGVYQILNTTVARSGFQNGFFLFEQDGYADGYVDGYQDGYITLVDGYIGQPYPLAQGFYSFDYFTYLSAPFDPVNEDGYIGSSFVGDRQINAIVDETKIVSIMLTDTRIGETVAANQETITKDFNSLKPLLADKNTLFLCHYEAFPLTNAADFYTVVPNGSFIQAATTVNSNFAGSAFITTEPIVIDNSGILNSTKEGTIEFWISPIYDTGNDPEYRYYFDASALVIENVVSLDEVTVQTVGRISNVVSVTLQNGDPTIDYFQGGRVEIGTHNAIAENTFSLSASSVMASKTVLQVITVKIVDDPTNHDYFQGGVIGTDGKTIFLGQQLPQSNLPLIITYKPAGIFDNSLNSQVIRLNKALPNSQTPVTVTYVPAGSQGDRISIYKDPSSFINFDVRASGINYVIQAPILWPRGSWHRVKATYLFNSGPGTDTIRLFVDGYEYGNLLFGAPVLFGDPHTFGSTSVGVGGLTSTIVFKDLINELYIGSQFNRTSSAFALFDNFRISNIARPVFAPFGESIDVNYNSNLSVAFPVTQDLYTTLLLDFGTLTTLITDFATLSDKRGGGFDFTVNVLDSFDIVGSSPTVKQILETLLNTLKPATSRLFIKYTE